MIVDLIYPSLSEVSELSSSRGGPLLQLHTFVADSDDTPSSCWMATSDSKITGLFPLHNVIICAYNKHTQSHHLLIDSPVLNHTRNMHS